MFNNSYSTPNNTSVNSTNKPNNVLIPNIPVYLKDFSIHKPIAELLLNFDTCFINHTLFYGPPNSGKRTLINAFLKNIFKEDLQKRVYYKEISYNNTKISVEYTASQYHYEINLCEYGFSDKFIITEFIQKLLSYKNINESYIYYSK